MMMVIVMLVIRMVMVMDQDDVVELESRQLAQDNTWGKEL